MILLTTLITVFFEIRYLKQLVQDRAIVTMEC